MAYEEYDMNDIKGPEDTADTRFQRFLLAVFLERQARGIYCVAIDINPIDTQWCFDLYQRVKRDTEYATICSMLPTIR